MIIDINKSTFFSISSFGKIFSSGSTFFVPLYLFILFISAYFHLLIISFTFRVILELASAM